LNNLGFDSIIFFALFEGRITIKLIPNIIMAIIMSSTPLNFLPKKYAHKILNNPVIKKDSDAVKASRAVKLGSLSNFDNEYNR
jgi:hypothetical protein